MKSNCLLYALGKMREKGGYIIASPSIHYPWCWHFQHAQSLGDLRISERIPAVPKPDLPWWRALLELAFHKGRVRYTVGDRRRRRFNLLRGHRWGTRFRERWPQSGKRSSRSGLWCGR